MKGVDSQKSVKGNKRKQKNKQFKEKPKEA